MDYIFLKLNLTKSMEEVIEFFCKKNLKKSISYNEKTKLNDIKKFIKRTIHNKNKTLNFLKKEKRKIKKFSLWRFNKREYIIAILQPRYQ